MKPNATTTHCVAHDDGAPSLSITDGKTALLFKCFTGCESQSIITALKARGLWEAAEKVTPIRSGNEPAAEYRYINAEGELVGVKGRFETHTPEGRKKDFRWKLPDSDRWGGLDGAGMETMPLYNLHAAIDNPDATVFVVEGEKAAQSLINRGTVAVCLAGGASQKRFGNALDVLRDRDVVLWPDNDDPGFALMANVAAYLPNASYVRPTVPEKGDAHDYFEQGGTVEALKALVQSGQPRVSIDGPNDISVTMPRPDGTVRFTFSEMTASARTIEAGLEVKANIPGLTTVAYRSRANLMSQSALSGHVTALNGFYGTDARAKDGIRWTNLLMTAASMAGEAWKGIDRSVSLAEVELVEERDWFVDKMVPANLVTIPFGMGGGGKSLTFGVHLVIHALLGIPWMDMDVRKVETALLVDYEDTQEEWRLRFEEVARGMGLDADEIAALVKRVRWLPGNGIPIVDQAETIRRLVEAENVGMMLVDSCISAVGGDLMDTGAAQRVVNWLTTVGREYDVTSLMLAHATKGDDEKAKQYPYGNVFWHNLPRATVFVESFQQDGSRVMDIVLRQRKGSRGKPAPVAMRIMFPEQDGGAITYERLPHIPTELMPDTVRTVNDRREELTSLLLSGARTAQEIATELGVADNNVRAILTGNPDLFRVVKKDGPRNVWGVVQREEMTPW